MHKIHTVRQVAGFLRERKKYWLAPILLSLVAIGLLIAVGESSALGPFIYPFF
jgi:hypothetical protein